MFFKNLMSNTLLFYIINKNTKKTNSCKFNFKIKFTNLNTMKKFCYNILIFLLYKNYSSIFNFIFLKNKEFFFNFYFLNYLSKQFLIRCYKN